MALGAPRQGVSGQVKVGGDLVRAKLVPVMAARNFFVPVFAFTASSAPSPIDRHLGQ
jgi:hypothetical protein